jgi:predicted transcriptional regulator
VSKLEIRIESLENSVNKFKNVYTDLKLLEQLGIIELKEEKGKIRPIVLYDELDIKIPLTTSKSP